MLNKWRLLRLFEWVLSSRFSRLKVLNLGDFVIVYSPPPTLRHLAVSRDALVVTIVKEDERTTGIQSVESWDAATHSQDSPTAKNDLTQNGNRDKVEKAWSRVNTRAPRLDL